MPLGREVRLSPLLFIVMANAVQIVNFALARLGADRILSLDDTDSENARLSNIHYEQTVREVLRAHPWNCCKTRATLGQLTETPSFEYNYYYQLPSDFLRALYVNDVNAEDNRDKWKIERDRLLSDDKSIQLVYIYHEEDAEQYDDLLVEALSVKLASKLAAPITGDPRSGTSFLDEFESVTMRRAARVDSSEDSSNENHPLLTHLTRSPLGSRRQHSPLG